MKKKVLFVLPILALASLSATKQVSIVKAEEESEITETSESEITEEEFTEKVKSWLSQYLDAKIVGDIITWATSGGLMVALF